MSKHKKNITICHLKINIFTTVPYRNILYGLVIVMHVETAGSLFDMRRSRKFSRGGGGGHLQTRVGPAPYQWNRHKSIKMGRSWHRFVRLVYSEARTRFDDIDKPLPSKTWVTTVVFSIKPREKNDGWAGNCFGSVRSSFVTLLSALCAF